MALYVAGKSGNPSGRPKHSVKTVRGMVERFIKRNMTPTKLQRMFATLSEKDRLEMLMQLLPYALAKQSPDSLTKEEIDRLYESIKNELNQPKKPSWFEGAKTGADV